MTGAAAAPAPGEAERRTPWPMLALFFIPSLIIIARLPLFPTSRWVTQALSLAELPKTLLGHTRFVLFVPLSGVVVCLFRLTLGLPVLGLFRPILVALAFRIIGIPASLAFLFVVLSAVVLVRPLFTGAHYYVRVPLLLSLTAACLVFPLLVDKWWHSDLLRHFAYFPVISLALICESFTKILNDRGLRAALWPTLNTMVVALVIHLVAQWPGTMRLLLTYPELLFLQAGIILVIGRYFAFEIFLQKNPFQPRAGLGAGLPAAPKPQLLGD